MFQFNAPHTQDPEYTAWYNSVSQRLKRGLTYIFGIDHIGKLFGLGYRVMVSIGFRHSSPHILVGADFGDMQDPWTLFAVVYKCNYREFILLNRRSQQYIDCSQCVTEQERIIDAQERVIDKTVFEATGKHFTFNRHNHDSNDEPDDMVGVVADNKPKTDGPREGAMLDWSRE